MKLMHVFDYFTGVLKEENSLVWHHVVLNWINKFVGLPPAGDEPQVQNPVRSKGQKAPSTVA